MVFTGAGEHVRPAPGCTASAAATMRVMFRRLGRDDRLTDGHGKVVKGVLA